MNLLNYDALSFDCYGTLIDWETGIRATLEPWASKAGLDMTGEDLLLAYADCEATAERETPTALYPEILANSFRRLGTVLNTPVTDEEAQRFGASVGDWPAFPDSHEALVSLAETYQLIILSNVDRASFAASNARLDVDFDLILTAQDIGSYKPSPRNFEHLLEAAGERNIAPERVLVVAQSLFHDHVPAKAAGLDSVWINRRHDNEGWGATPPPPAPVTPDLEFPSMQAFADAVKVAKSA
ncbi:haloacid dehalogenase, type II [Mycobacterium sp. MS1601]|nr:haloacid dehalogenase, type II [Mycobacterium sp. MS1601]